MKPIYGEFDCKLDSKGRFLLPSGLRKQLPEDQQDEFVINKGLDECLVIYPVKVWEEELRKIFSRNQYVQKNRAFARRFQNGAANITLDGNGRALIPRRLMGVAGIEKEVVLVAQFDRIEVWDRTRYEAWQQDDEFDLDKLAEEVMTDDEKG